LQVYTTNKDDDWPRSLEKDSREVRGSEKKVGFRNLVMRG
jgi:hypothetical protein